jgi:hypothetical protein
MAGKKEGGIFRDPDTGPGFPFVREKDGTVRMTTGECPVFSDEEIERIRRFWEEKEESGASNVFWHSFR